MSLFSPAIFTDTLVFTSLRFIGIPSIDLSSSFGFKIRSIAANI